MASKKKQKVLKELTILLLYFIVTAFIIVYIGANYLVTVLLLWGIPSIYISIRKPEIIRKTFLYSIFFALPITFLVDYLAHVNLSWYVPSVIGIRILDTFPIDEFTWGFFYVYFIVSFYEYFFDRDRNKNIFSHNTIRLFYIISLALFAFGLLFIVNKELLVIKFFYILFILFVILIPSSIILYKYPTLFQKIVLQGLYFFILTIIYELTALYLNQWYFPGKHYIGFVELFNFKFPFEEFLWLVLTVPACLCIYEYYADDRK